MTFSKILAVIGLCLAVAGCSTVNLRTAMLLNALDPLDADPADYEIAADLPDAAYIPDRGAVLNFYMTRSDTGEERREEYRLQQRISTDGRALFRVNPDDYAAINDFRTLARTWGEEYPGASSGGFGVNVTVCENDPGVAPDETFSISIRVTQDGPFLPLIRNASVAQAIENFDGETTTTPHSLCE